MKLNREEIIKALECCTSGNSVSACMSGCPLYEQEYCECVNDDTALLKYALALIKELTDELENLKKVKYIFSTVDYCSDDLADAYEENKRLTEDLHDTRTELTRVQEKNERLSDLCKMKDDIINKIAINSSEMYKMLSKIILEVKIDIVREMQSLIKERCIKGGIYPAFVADVIDQIAKELLEG